MEDEIAVRRLVEMLSAFYIEGIPVEEDLTCSLTNEFLENTQIAFLSKQSVILHRWQAFLKVLGYKMLFSPEMYLRYVIHACRFELKFNFNIFEKLLGVLALLIYLTSETLRKAEVDFCDFIPDIFMVFYSSELKKIFLSRGGFDKFARYINNPQYIALKSSDKRLPLLSNPFYTADVKANDLSQLSNLLQNIKLEAKKDHYSLSLTQKVLISTKVELPVIPNNAYAKLKLREWDEETSGLSNEERNQALEELDEALEKLSLGSDLSPQDSSSDSSPQTIIRLSSSLGSSSSDIIGQRSSSNTSSSDEGQIKFPDNIVKAAIRYNNSTYSGIARVNNSVLKEADDVLDRMLCNIASGIEILFEYDTE